MENNKKITAPNSLAATSVEQSANNSNEIISENVRHNKENINKMGQLETKSMEEIYDTMYALKMPIIDNLLYSGVYLFVGAPKIGKSFAMAQIGYHVSAGKELWGYPVKQGTVLYLALEDDEARLQSRLAKMFDMDTNANFHFATKADKINMGLEQQILAFIQCHKDTRLVIIDTLQKVRECTGATYSYANDYDVVARLKQIADENKICILIVHHTRKMEASDSFDTVSGTNGLLGAADGAFVMQKEKRTDNKATVDIVGRDIADQRLNMEFDYDRCVWKLVKAEKELWKDVPDPFLVRISKLVSSESSKWRGTATELLEILGAEMSASILVRKLNVNRVKMYSDYNIIYENIRTHDEKIIQFTLSKQ